MLDQLFSLLARGFPEGRDGLIVALGVYVARNAVEIGHAYTPTWLILATVAVAYGLLALIVRSVWRFFSVR